MDPPGTRAAADITASFTARPSLPIASTGLPAPVSSTASTMRIVIAPPPALGAAALTVSLWARIDTGNMQGWTHCLIAQDNGDDHDQSRRVFQLSVFDGHVVWHRMVCARDPGGRRLVVPGAWFHVAAVVDGSRHRLYVDGTLQDSVRHPGRSHAEEPIRIGRKGTPEPYFFTRGAIDDVRVYNRALGAGEIEVLYRESGFVSPIDARRRAAPPISGLWGMSQRHAARSPLR